MFFKRLKMTFLVAARLRKVFYQMIWGAWRISKLKEPVVTIFGGARFKLSDPYAVMAEQLSKRFVEAGVSILSGGSTGIMEAVSYGVKTANDGKGKSIGIGVKDLHEGRNPYVTEYFELNYFFARKWLLARFANAFIVFPGGLGTIDEMSEIITLMQTKHMPCVPILLIGVEYWRPAYEWVKNEALRHGTIRKEEMDLFTITDDLDVAFDVIHKHCKSEMNKK